MVEEEHWIVRSPLRSRIAFRHSSAARAETSHIASHDEMRTAVWALHCPVRTLREVECNYQTITYPWTFEIGLETFKVAKESIHQEVVVGPCEASVDENGWVDRRGRRIVGERVGYISQGLGRVGPSDAMRPWVHPDDVLEASTRDLTVVVGISPTTQSILFVGVEHRRVLGIEGILHMFFQTAKSLGGRKERTEGPVPVWGHSGVATLAPQRVFKMFDEIAVPWQEESGEVNLI